MVACGTLGEKIYNAEEFNYGDSIGNFTVHAVKLENDSLGLTLAGKTIVKDTLDRAPINNQEFRIPS
jgi:hypothetical protein